jgi:outer membrane translocation and assembly module TamA
MSRTIALAYRTVPQLRSHRNDEPLPADAVAVNALQTVEFGGRATVRPARWFSIGAGASAVLVENSDGSGSFPSIETVFDPSTAPGLMASPDYLHTEATAAIDWRESEGYTRRGGYYAVTVHRYDDRSDNLYTFNKVEADVRQFIPLLNEHWVIALRGLVSTTDQKSDQQVPYFLLPYLGGSTTLRGYPDGRFRDRHAMLLSAEYRWIPGRVLDMALFVDAGKVAARREDLDFEDLRTSYGIGARFHAPAATVLRTELAHGREGYRFHFTFGKSF